MRRALVLLTVLGLLVLTVALVASVSRLAGVAHAAISSIKPASGETTPGGAVRATVTVDSGLLTTCLTATSDDQVNIAVTFDGLALSCGKGTWSSDMKVSVSTLIEPGSYTVHVQEVDLLGSVLQSHAWPLTVTAPTTTTTTTTTTSTSTTTTTTTLVTLPPPTLPKLSTTTTTTSTTTTTTPTSSTTTTADLEAGGSTTTIDFGETSTTVVAGAGGDDDDPDGGGDGAGLRQTSIGVGGDVPRGLFGPTPEVLSFEVTAGYANAVELIEASWVWVLGLALMIAAALIKGIDRRLDHEAPDSGV